MDRPTVGSVQILRGNALALALADESVDLIVTSPPYFGLRSYQDGGEHYAGQIGDEPTPAEFVDALIAATAEMVRVLKPSGSIWVNLGDKYAGGGNGPQGSGGVVASSDYGNRSRQPTAEERRAAMGSTRPKSLIGIPWRYAIRCIDDLGLILRAEVIWSKPNGLPESVTDRVRRSHEQWFSFSKSGGVEAESQSFPFCPLCGRPVDARATLVARLKELHGGVVPDDLTHHEGSHLGVQDERPSGANQDVAAVARGAGVSLLVEGHAERIEDGADLHQDPVVAVVDHHAEVRGSVPAVAETHGPLSVDDAGQPSEFCTCVGHPLIIDDEPWIPQSLAAEIMQRVAEGEIDPQQAADFLAGDYVRNHSVWFHFTREPRYFSAVDEIREPSGPEKACGPGAMRGPRSIRERGTADPTMNNPLGKLPGSVWTVATEPLHVPESLGIDHFAAFPTEWPRRIIQGWSPRGICVECGEGRRRERSGAWHFQTPGHEVRQRALRQAQDAGVTADLVGTEYGTKTKAGDNHSDGDRNVHPEVKRLAADFQISRLAAASAMAATKRGMSDTEACACPEPTAPTRPAVVLDPFGGTGTTALVAKALGRHGISNDMSADYCRLAGWRTTDPKQLAKAARRPFVPPAEQTEGQLDLLEGIA